MVPRYCLLGNVDPGRLAEYPEAHRAVWPELLAGRRDDPGTVRDQPRPNIGNQTYPPPALRRTSHVATGLTMRAIEPRWRPQGSTVSRTTAAGAASARDRPTPAGGLGSTAGPDAAGRPTPRRVGRAPARW